jgi:predicted patatin/cPLA2 family phospholipase
MQELCMDAPFVGVYRAMRGMARLARLAVLGGVIAHTGCGTLLRNPVPAPLTTVAEIPHLPEVRAWPGVPSPAMEQDLVRSFAQESRKNFPRAADGKIHYAHLALSGGGARGAFGAGFLNGWSHAGDRPTFKIVTGVSTGALMAPFAFLGPSYDAALREFYTTTSSSDIFLLGSYLNLAKRLLAGEALLDTDPLITLIARHVDADLMRRVGEAHEHGQRLYIGTVDLDSLRFVVWNMGLIALSGRPESLDLFRQVMLASASIPIAFPPVLFEVEADGRRYDEMHVDGGVGARVFYNEGMFAPSIMRNRGGQGADDGRESIFLIHNGQLVPVARPTRRTVVGIATRILDASSRAAVTGDLNRIYTIARNTQADFHWITIPEGIAIAEEEVFDPVAMRALYDVGYRSAAAGAQWATRPPGLGVEAPP